MDKQRATRTGLANAFFVAKLRDETVAELIQVQNELRKQYIGVEGCLSRPESFHVTLVGAHVSCNEDMEILMKALDSFSNDEQENSSEPTLLRGLGSWKTAGGSYCLFGEVLHAQHIASLAVSLSRHLMAVCNAREDGCFGSSFSWVDVVTEELYQPHVTIAMIDPRIDGKVWESVEAKSGRSGKKEKKKLSAREKGKREGRRDHVMKTRDESFGREPKLFAHELHQNKKIVFGEIDMSCIFLER